MAKENYVYFIGQVKNPPRITTDEATGRPTRASVTVRTLSRDIYGRIGEFQYNNCEILVMTGNESIIRNMSKIQPFDFIEIKGTVTTKEMKRVVECPVCNHKHIVKNNYCFVTPTYVGIRAHASSRTAGADYLKRCAEASNIFKGIGRLCVPPTATTYDDGSLSCHYQVAINRKLFLADGNPDVHTDYPWIKTTGELAQENMDVLQVGSLIFLDGYLRSVSREVKTRCDNVDCASEFTYKCAVMEIIPYSVEYLQNCILPDSTYISEETRESIQGAIEGKNRNRSEYDAEQKRLAEAGELDEDGDDNE